MTPPSIQILADALHAYYPVTPVDPDDITTWPADMLDELGLWDAAVNGFHVEHDPDDLDGHDHTATFLEAFQPPPRWDLTLDVGDSVRQSYMAELAQPRRPEWWVGPWRHGLGV